MATALRRRVLATLSRVRSCSTGADVSVNVDTSGVARVTMHRRPANAVDDGFLQTLKGTFEKLAADRVAGAVLCSSVPKFFSSGLDVTKMTALTRQELKEHAELYYDCWRTLYESPLPTAAAITGHAPGVGCLLALVCERRVMVADCGNIGLNEAAFGFTPDRVIAANFRAVLPPLAAEQALLSGRLFTAAEAFEAGLVDELATDREDALSKCESFIRSFAKIPAEARGRTKRVLRRDVMRSLACPGRDEFVSELAASADLFRAVFQAYSDKLKSKRNDKLV